MFHSEGPARSERQDRALAGYLAAVAGFVNAGGFVLIGVFTSHVTGNIGRLGDDVARGDGPAGVAAASLVLTFFAGAFLASMAIESRRVARRPSVYGALLLVEAALLAGFMELERRVGPSDPRARDAAAALLCVAMGMQNSFVTRLSGAVVRTTHLTGVVTDLGIEAARWFRYWRGWIAAAGGVRLTLSREPTERPHVPKALLLVAILGGYVGGGIAGAVLAVRLGAAAMVAPIAALAIGAALSFLTLRAPIDPTSRR